MLHVKESCQIWISRSQWGPLHGSLQVVVCDAPCGRVGLGVCYDLRFPWLSDAQRFEHGCDVLTYPSAFTQKTGKFNPFVGSMLPTPLGLRLPPLVTRAIHTYSQVKRTGSFS